jgi:hypothetical protein
MVYYRHCFVSRLRWLQQHHFSKAWPLQPAFNSVVIIYSTGMARRFTPMLSAATCSNCKTAYAVRCRTAAMDQQQF